MYKCGIIYVEDIYNFVEKTVMTYEQARYEYGDFGSFIEYYAVIKAIPIEWKTLLRGDKSEICEEDSMINGLRRCKKPVKKMYNLMLGKKEHTDSGRLAWNKELGVEFDCTEWGKIRRKCYNMTLSVKLRYFQYKTLSRKLVTKALRHKWDSSISENCTFCKTERETILHILIDCTKVQKLWQKLATWCKQCFGLNVTLDKKEMILNNYKGPSQLLVNTIVLQVGPALFEHG